jgi:peptidoglycan DL-endopeptidase CwlO
MAKPMVVSRGAAGSKKRASLFLILLVVLSMLAVDLAPAQGQTTRQRLQDAQRRAQELHSRLDQASAEHSRRQSELYETRAQISATRRRIEETEGQIGHLRGALRDRVRTAYRMGGLGFFQFLLSAESFRDFSLRVVMLERQSADDEQLVLELRKLRAELTGQERMLDQQREAQSSQVAAIRDQVRSLESTFQEMQSLVDSLEGQVR